jgi:hypothetical protein
MKFNYQKICSDFMKGLPSRTTGVIERRFGLKSGKRETLEAIGKSYGLTRERIRQIEKDGFSEIENRIKEHQDVFNYFKKVLNSFGGFKREETLLSFLAEEKFKNHILFLLAVNSDFQKISESKDLYSFWVVDKNSFTPAKKIIKQVINFLKKEKKPFKLEKLFNAQKKDFLKIFGKKLNKNIFQSCLELSKEIQKNPDGEYGLKHWLVINPRGIKDRAYLVLKKEKAPLHFKEITALIEELPFPYPKKVHAATVHNELIKNEHFVLVGRGLYALKEWGYFPGVVKDVIVKVLKEAKKPLSKREISEKVLKERFVKENTIFLNLNNKNYFLRDGEGRYGIREA